jgi:arylsulfatase A-like enzyme
VNEKDTPELAKLASQGSRFSDHHASYPTFTMVNSASLAAGGPTGTTGLYGNWVWQPAALKHAANGDPIVSDAGAPAHYTSPVFLEDYNVVRDLDRLYDGALLHSGTLFEVAQAHHLTTAAIGKSGSALLQDRHALDANRPPVGYVLDEKGAWPSSFASELLAAGLPVPKTTAAAYPPGVLTVNAETNGDPTGQPPPKRLADGLTSDPTDDTVAPAADDNAYLMRVFTHFVLPTKKPALSVVWLRNPDTAEHIYGPGTPDAKRALRAMDDLLGRLIEKLHELKWRDSTDLVIVSDHGHSTVSGSLDAFPLRAIVPGAKPTDGRHVGDVDASGYSVSGDVRIADLLHRLGKFAAYDGGGCLADPGLSGRLRDGKPLYPLQTDDAAGTVCGKDPTTGKGSIQYNTPAYRLPKELPVDAVVVAINGGSDYVYVPSHDPTLVQRVVTFLQTREEVGPLFVAPRYASIAGTLTLADVGIDTGDDRRNPDIVVGYAYDENATVAGMRGILYAGAQNVRGMHGSFSPVDVHNTLIATGPDFRKTWVDTLPTANADVAPTLAAVLGLTLQTATGRPLLEALASQSASALDYKLDEQELKTSAEATGLRVLLPTDTDGSKVDKTKTKYHVVVAKRRLVRNGVSYTYYDWSKGVRE